MKLCYRGVPYEYNPHHLETTEGRAIGQYRGIAWHPRYLRQTPKMRQSLAITYRGARAFLTGQVTAFSN